MVSLLLSCVGVQPRVTPSCIPAGPDSLSPFGKLDLSQLPAAAEVRVCEARTPEAGGVLFVKGFADAEEVALLSEVGLSQFSQDQPDSKGYGNRFLRAGPDRSFATEHQAPPAKGVSELAKQRLLRRINARMDAMTGSQWREPYLQFVLQNETGKTGAHWGDMRVHHERHHEETGRKEEDYSPRYATVLVYLRNPPQGGHTLFPTLRSGAAPPTADADAMQAAVRATLTRRTLRTTSPAIVSAEQYFGRTMVDHINHHQQDLRDSELERPLLGEMCRDVREAEEAGDASPFFAIRGEPGDAAIFWPRRGHWTTNMTSEWVEHWHGGCPALGGNKFAMQSYREASAYYWLKLHNRLGKELLLQRRDAASGLAETVATIPQAAGNVHFEYLGTPGEALQVVSRDGSYTRKLKNVKPSDEGRAAVIELKERGQASRIPTGMKRRAIFDDVVTPADKDEL